MPVQDRRIENSIHINASPQRVWDALTLERELNRWETVEAHLDLRRGGDFLYVYEYGPPRPGTFLVVEPPYKMVQLNLVFNQDRSFRYVNTNTLRETADGVELKVEVEGFGDDEVERWICESMDLGWETDLQVLRGWVEEGVDLRSELWRGLHMGVAYLRAEQGGIRLLEVHSGGPAARAGLAYGDVIVGFDARPVADFRGFRRLLSEHEIGDTVTLSVLRGQRSFDCQLTFGDVRSPAQEPAVAELVDALTVD
jgi:uncharacterized protein YndB with AHSA1/START domain